VSIDEDVEIEAMKEQIIEDENKNTRFQFRFSTNILWTVYFAIDKDAKTMTCKLSNTPFKFTKSAKTPAANAHLSGSFGKVYIETAAYLHADQYSENGTHFL